MYIYVSVLDGGMSDIQANPVNFTLSTPGGYTQLITDDMFRLSNDLEATNYESYTLQQALEMFFHAKSAEGLWQRTCRELTIMPLL